MRKLKGWRALLYGFSFIACLSLTCCSGTHRFYKGPELPREKVAHLTNKTTRSVRLLAIDGQYGPHGKDRGYSSGNGFFDIELVPGSYKLTFKVSMQEPTRVANSNPVVVELRVEAGEIFDVIAKLDMVGNNFKVVVLNTKKRVVADAGPFPMTVTAVKRHGRGGLTFEQGNAIIQQTLPPLNR
jgi:hypothetical protein